MLQGMPPLVLLHVAISLVAILSGLIVLFHGLLASRRLPGWTSLFLWSTVATSLSGFILPAARFLPSHATGVVSMIALAVAIPALYKFRLAGGWRPAYIIGAVAALYLNVFVLVVQLFLKVPALKALAPTQKESPFLIAQGAVLLAFLVFGFLASRRFHPAPVVPATAGRQRFRSVGISYARGCRGSRSAIRFGWISGQASPCFFNSACSSPVM